VRELLRKGADVDLVNEDGDNALMAAALSGHEGTVSALLDANAKVNASANNTGLTPLMAAAGRAHTGAVMVNRPSPMVN
jgi:ankyrin repeat protein